MVIYKYRLVLQSPVFQSFATFSSFAINPRTLLYSQVVLQSFTILSSHLHVGCILPIESGKPLHTFQKQWDRYHHPESLGQEDGNASNVQWKTCSQRGTFQTMVFSIGSHRFIHVIFIPSPKSTSCLFCQEWRRERQTCKCFKLQTQDYDSPNISVHLWPSFQFLGWKRTCLDLEEGKWGYRWRCKLWIN